jgi:hypothetical protein
LGSQLHSQLHSQLQSQLHRPLPSQLLSVLPPIPLCRRARFFLVWPLKMSGCYFCFNLADRAIDSLLSRKNEHSILI